jgi:hypothetical protein
MNSRTTENHTTPNSTATGTTESKVPSTSLKRNKSCKNTKPTKKVKESADIKTSEDTETPEDTKSSENLNQGFGDGDMAYLLLASHVEACIRAGRRKNGPPFQ